jgi:hypothetical protein
MDHKYLNDGYKLNIPQKKIIFVYNVVMSYGRHVTMYFLRLPSPCADAASVYVPTNKSCCPAVSDVSDVGLPLSVVL